MAMPPAHRAEHAAAPDTHALAETGKRARQVAEIPFPPLAIRARDEIAAALWVVVIATVEIMEVNGRRNGRAVGNPQVQSLMHAERAPIRVERVAERAAAHDGIDACLGWPRVVGHVAIV